MGKPRFPRPFSTFFLVVTRLIHMLDSESTGDNPQWATLGPQVVTILRTLPKDAKCRKIYRSYGDEVTDTEQVVVGACCGLAKVGQIINEYLGPIGYPLIEVEKLFRLPLDKETETQLDTYDKILLEDDFHTDIRKPPNSALKEYVMSASEVVEKLRRIVDRVGSEAEEEEGDGEEEEEASGDAAEQEEEGGQEEREAVVTTLRPVTRGRGRGRPTTPKKTILKPRPTIPTPPPEKEEGQRSPPRRKNPLLPHQEPKDLR